jgi:sulfoxide reductase catalytic subunit YedY
MLIKIPRGWEMPESAATPEHLFHDRRRFAKALAAGSILAAAAPLIGATPARAAVDGLYPAERNPAFTLGDRPLTAEQEATTYNNYYEFGSHKQISRAAQALKLEPWTVRFDGMVEQERDVDFDTLIKAMPLEERLYRHRCVEAWAMAVPWSGFAMRHLVEYAKPLASAKYVVMQTAEQKDTMPGLRQFWYPWPYTEGLTIAEATNDLAFMVTGMYGKPAPKQNGAPLRLAVPWKYGFKSVKSIVRFHFTDERPETFWHKLQANEYGFWANINPEVPHPRWSQASEWWLGGSESDRHPTMLYNGYAEFVADMYKDIKGEQLFR